MSCNPRGKRKRSDSKENVDWYGQDCTNFKNINLNIFPCGEDQSKQRNIDHTFGEISSLLHENPPQPVFFPTMHQFLRPIECLKRISELALPFGICKVIPPAEWKPQNCINFDHKKKMETKFQKINELQRAEPFDDGEEYTLKEFRKMANRFKRNWVSTNLIHFKHAKFDLLLKKIEEKYWEIIEQQTNVVEVEYANDLEVSSYMSGFPILEQAFQNRKKVYIEDESKLYNDGQKKNDFTEYYQKTGWNLNNTAFISGSLLSQINVDISGVNVPWLYCGMLFATFCWHVEDNFFHSINYMHHGSPKQWYGVGSQYADFLEEIVKAEFHHLFEKDANTLFHMNLQFSPKILTAKNISFTSLVQNCGEFIITLPRAYHAGFSYGFNITEATNFALCDWLPFGLKSVEIYRDMNRGSIINFDQLLMTLTNTNLVKSNFSIQEQIVLLNVFIQILKRELNERHSLKSQNFEFLEAYIIKTNSNHLSTEINQFNENNVCWICQFFCYFSIFQCSNCGKNSCLKHWNISCGCDPTSGAIKSIFEFFSENQLQEQIEDSQQKIIFLEGGEKEV